MKRIDWLLEVMQQGYTHKVVYAGNVVKVYRNSIDLDKDKPFAVVIMWEYSSVRSRE